MIVVARTRRYRDIVNNIFTPKHDRNKSRAIEVELQQHVTTTPARIAIVFFSRWSHHPPAHGRHKRPGLALADPRPLKRSKAETGESKLNIR